MTATRVCSSFIKTPSFFPTVDLSARLILAWALFVLVTMTARPESSQYGDKIVAFCQAHLNQMVGNGECAELAGHAMRAAGVKVLHVAPDSPGPGDYVWGRQVFMIEATPDGPKETGVISDVLPGDILQYRDVQFGGNGGFHHHTAVVAEVMVDNGKIKIYQQNVGGQRIVVEGHCEGRSNSVTRGGRIM